MMKTKLKFFLVLLAMMVGGVNRAWAGAVYFQNTTIDLNFSTPEQMGNVLTSATDPDNSTSCYTYQQDVWWVWFTGDTPINLKDVLNRNAEDKDFDWSVDVTGDINILCSLNHIDNHYNLKRDEENTANNATKYGSHIYFTLTNGASSSGTIIVTATNPDFDGKPYTCSYTININMDIHSTKWDFYSKAHTTSNNNWTDVKVEGSESNNAKAYTQAVHGENGVFGASFASEISETAGLRFDADANKIISMNPSGSEPVDQRYVGLMGGSTLIIPKETWSSHTNASKKTRIRIKMGRYGGTGIRLTIGNGLDAKETEITGTGTYEIGGCAWWGPKGDNHQRGEYHFIVNSKASDFTIKLESNSGAILKLYSIEVYESADLITENSILGNSYQLLNNQGAETGATGTYYLHYRGKGESTKIDASKISFSGNITTTTVNKGFNTLDASLAEGEGESNIHTSPTHTYTSNVGNFGTFGMEIACYTHGVKINSTTYQYCTDYAFRRQSVGYMASQEYPYTWDFKDVFTYKYGGGRMENAPGAEGGLTNDNLHLWSLTGGDPLENDAVFGLRVGLDAGHNIMYCGGSQLWYGNTIIPETAGLGFTPVNYDYAYNYALSLSANGLTFDQSNRDWWGWRVTVPSVPVGGAVYIQAHKDRSDIFYGVKYYVGWEPYTVKENGVDVTKYKQVNNKTPMTAFPTETNDGSGIANIISTTGDEVVYAIYNNHNVNEDITLFFNGITVHKMAVSTDFKQVNKYGWTTESRERDIDPELTSYMTGQDFTTFLVTNVDYPNKKVEMTPIDNDHLMPYAENTGERNKNACIICNNAGTPVNIVNGGFHLFVPDMHEGDNVAGEGQPVTIRKPYADTSSSMMKAQLAPIAADASYDDKIHETEGSYTNYAFTYLHKETADGNIGSSELEDGGQAFYRIAKDGASSAGHQGYLQLETSQLPSESRIFTLSFVDELEPDITAIENVQNKALKADVYFNLNGQQLNGRPSQRGLYIVNGKKMYVK